MREKRYQQRLSDGIEIYHKDKLMKIQRKYKKPYHFQILYRSESGIDTIAKDEVFVRLFDYKSVWTSNYGRIIQRLNDGTYQLVKGVYSRATKELTYTLDRNIYFKSKNRWGYRKEKVTASDLVIQMFVVNYDMKNNTMVWHKKNDTKDNYYKHLFPVTDKQYNEILSIYEQDREKRVINQFTTSLDATNDSEEECSILDFIPSDFDTFEEVTKNNNEQFQDKVQQYISKLSNQQVNILNLLIDGYTPKDIRQILEISSTEYAENMKIMRSFENVKILF